MHSFIVASKDSLKSSEKVSEILEEFKIDIFDRNFFSFEKAAGIEEIKKIAEKLYLKPFKSDKKALILDLSNGITPQAQNSLLKTLEEPPISTIIIMVAISKDDFLPTIISRCKVFEVGENISPTTDEGKKYVSEIIEATDGRKMEIAQEFGKDRESALKFAQELVIAASEMAKKGESEKYLSLLKNMNQAYISLKFSNINPRFILENYFFKI